MRHRNVKLRIAHRALRLQVIAHLGGCCVRCGFADWRALQVDHVLGGGLRARREGNVYWIYSDVLKDKTGKYQLLCANCNWIKRYENDEHGHWNAKKE